MDFEGSPARDVVADKPGAAVDPWTAAMRCGDFEAAWRVSDDILGKRLASGKPFWEGPRHLQQVWDGRPLAGRRVLVRCYHGLGDTIQFIRFAAPLRRIASEVIVWVQPELIPLVGRARGVDRVIPLHDGTPDIEFDAGVEIMELPHALRTTLQSLPRQVPYLQAPRSRLPLRESGNAAVGLAWQAGDWDRSRSIPTGLMHRLSTPSNVTLCSLQLGSGEVARAIPGCVDLSAADILEVAARLRSLDLFITVDTMLAHLAGALGVPTWTLLPQPCDWRWMCDRADSPWYPTMRLFRQPRPGEWESVLHEVGIALGERFCPLGASRIRGLADVRSGFRAAGSAAPDAARSERA